MSQVRRSVGGFVLAAVVATGLVLTPKQADAVELGFCKKIDAAIAYLEAQEPNPLRDAFLARLYAVNAAYCS